MALAAGMMMAAAAIATAAAPAHAESEEQAGNKVPPPYEQLRQGTPLQEVLCADHKVLAVSPDGRPACLWPETAQSLADRGWEVPANAPEEGSGAPGGQAQVERQSGLMDTGAPDATDPEGSAVEAAATTEVAPPAPPPADGEPLAVTLAPAENGPHADGSPEPLPHDPRYYVADDKITLQGVEKRLPNPTGVWMPVTKEDAEQVVMPRLAAALGDKLILPELTDYEACMQMTLSHCSDFLNESDPPSLSYYKYNTEKGNTFSAWKSSGQHPDIIYQIKYRIYERVPYEEREEFFRSFMENAGFNVTKVYIGHYNGRIYGGMVPVNLEFLADHNGPFIQLVFRGWGDYHLNDDLPEGVLLPREELKRHAHAFAAAHVDLWDKEKCSLRLKGVETVDIYHLTVVAGIPLYGVEVGHCHRPDNLPRSLAVMVEATEGEIIWPIDRYYIVGDWADKIDIPESAKVGHDNGR